MREVVAMLATWDIRWGNRPVMHDEESFLATTRGCEYNQHDPLCVYALTMRLFSGRRGFHSCFACHLDQATRLFPLARAPRTYVALDQTTTNFLSAWYASRSEQKQSRAACGKRAVTTPAHHPPSTGPTTRLPEDGPTSPGAPGQDGSDLETGALSCPAGDAAAASIVSSFACAGSIHPRRARTSRGSRPR